MEIEYSERFEEELFDIYLFIAKESIMRADTFVDELKNSIETLVDMPYRCRQSLKSDNVQIRDLLFKGYVVPYRVRSNVIEIIGIFNQNRWEL